MSDYGSSSCCDGAQIIFDEKDPDATLDYQFNWAPYLEDDEIATSAFLLPDGLTEVSSQNTATAATIFVSGGNPCGIYRITNRITTAAGRAQDRTIYIRVRDL
jgi:hypothetical protein